MKRKCIQPEIGQKIALEITFNAARGAGVCLSAQQCKHLMECGCCREDLPALFKATLAGQRTMQASEIYRMVQRKDPTILHKEVHSGTALFRPYGDDPKRGLYVRVGKDNRLYDPEEMTLDAFNRLD
jgi:hypothetical protein